MAGMIGGHSVSNPRREVSLHADGLETFTSFDHEVYTR